MNSKIVYYSLVSSLVLLVLIFHQSALAKSIPNITLKHSANVDHIPPQKSPRTPCGMPPQIRKVYINRV